MSTPQPDVRRVLSTLKDFQRDTVDHVFDRMYRADSPALRFLIADEVGLGKTMVARGIVARVVEKLWDTVKRIDVIYVCSNTSIARQNINRLNVTGRPDHRLPDRITLLPRDIRTISDNKINFISFTPGTSFQLKSSQGKASERALLYWLLPDDWKGHAAGAVSVLTGGADRSRFEGSVFDFRSQYSIDEPLQRRFHERLTQAMPAPGQPALSDRFTRLADTLGRRGKGLTPEEWTERTAIVSELRNVLAAVCVESLEPDLVILDEFQRFSDLLHGQDEASGLARQLFNCPDVRVLLLSATPYKMFAVGEDETTSDHYSDLVQTIGFLQNDDARNQRFRDSLGMYRKGLFQYPLDNGQLLRQARDAVTEELSSVMVRTERLAVTRDRSGMLVEVASRGTDLRAGDIESFLRLQTIARSIGHGDTIEYWKSAPYLLNFMDDYQLKEDFTEALDRGLSKDIAALCEHSPGLFLSQSDVEAFNPIDPGNARLRSLAADTIDSGLWRMAWLPPSLPYYKPEGEFATTGLALPTKRLVFSAWQIVPKVVASFLSYEAERLMLGSEAGKPGSFLPEARRTRGRLLDFAKSGDRLGGMPVLGLLYPSVTLAHELDPLRWRAESGDRVLSAGEAIARARTKCEELLATLDSGTAGGRSDETWYWAAPILLDVARYAESSRNWWGQADLAGRWRSAPDADPDDRAPDEELPAAGTGEDRWSDHVEEARLLLRGEIHLGRRPDDLADVMALSALGGPGTCALRALSRVTGGVRRASEVELRNEAGWIAEGLRSLFNQPDVTAMLRDPTDSPVAYWLRALEYSVRGGLQSVLDEYAHMLVEYHGLSGRSWRRIGADVATEIASALKFRTANVLADMIHTGAGGVTWNKSLPFRFRSRFAVRYGGRGDEGSPAKRENALRRAFNSPFWPFVLCSTSVGQEGLDFHLYCHAVVHWNLPSNPVDLEQREGRVHRFKGHAVRKNVAAAHAGALTLERLDDVGDPWAVLFEDARASPTERTSDLSPYWVYPIDGGARIERHVPLIVLSQDVDRADALRRSLALYRMAFGQSRQEDLVRYLLAHIPADEVEKVATELAIKLGPCESPRRGESGAAPRPSEEDEVAEDVRTAPFGLEDLKGLLDAFADLTGKRRTLTTHVVAELLDEFGAARIRTARAGERGL